MTLYDLRVSVEFDAAHFLPNYQGKCENLHGHRWKVNVTIVTNKKCTNGMIIDFTEIKRYIDENYDHRILNKCPFEQTTIDDIRIEEKINLLSTPFKWGSFDNPTAENIAETIATDVINMIPVEISDCIGSVSVEVHETPKSSVTCTKLKNEW